MAEIELVRAVDTALVMNPGADTEFNSVRAVDRTNAVTADTDD